MTMYTLTVSTAELGLGVLSNARITVKRKRTVVSDVFPSTNITSQETVTNVSGIATILLAADDGTVFHEVRIHNSRDMVIYFKAFTMPPQDVALDLLPLEDIVSASVYQAIQAREIALDQLASKANLEDVYTKSQTYTKAEVDATFTAYVGGRKAYTTLALAQADQANLPANTAIEVTNDTTSSNNGTYQWNGTTLTKSAYDPLTQAKADATTKANTAEDNAKSYTDLKIGELPPIDKDTIDLLSIYYV